MAHDVFVSYSHKDKAIADAVVAGMENRGIRCWFAPRDITPGSSWGESIINAIEGSRIMVIILSGHSNRSSQVVREVERAVANNVIIIPFRIENIDPTGAMAYFLSTEHWLDAITPPLDKHIQKLINTILVFQGEKEADELKAEETALQTSQGKFPTKVLFAVLVGVLVISVAIFVLPRLLSDRTSPEDEDPGMPNVHLTDPSSEVFLPSATTQVMASMTETPTETPLPPQLPSLEVVGKWQTSREAKDVFVQNNTAYIANGEDGLRILDVSNVSNPREIGSFDLKNAVSVIVVDEIAYVIEEGQLEDNRALQDQLKLIDVSNPAIPRLMGEFTPEGGFIHRNLNNFAVSEGVAYLTVSDRIIAVDVSNPAQPTEIGVFSFHSNISSPGVFVHEGIVYMQANRFHVVDFRDPAEPEEIGGFNAEWGSSVVVIDQIAYIVGWDTGLTILDVSDPARPIKLGQFMELIGNYDLLPRGAASRQTFLVVSISGDVAYVSFSFGIDQGTWTQFLESGIVAIDISDPTEPILLDKFTEFDQVSSVFALDDVLFVTDSTRGLFILSEAQ
jgi:hypothetical protein